MRWAPKMAKILSPWSAMTMPRGKVTAITGSRQRVLMV